MRDIMREWLEAKKEYGELIEARERLFDQEGVEGLKRDNPRFVKKEAELLEKTEKLRNEVLGANKETRTFNTGKDVGYLICGECWKMFRFPYQYFNKDGTKNQQYEKYNDKHSFKNCCEHTHLRSKLTISIKTDFSEGIFYRESHLPHEAIL